MRKILLLLKHREPILQLVRQVAFGTERDAIETMRFYSGCRETGVRLHFAARRIFFEELRREKKDESTETA